MQVLKIDSYVLNEIQSHRPYKGATVLHKITISRLVPCFNVHVGS